MIVVQMFKYAESTVCILQQMRTVLLAGGLGFVTLVGALFTYHSRKTLPQIPQQKIIATAKLLRQQMFMVLVQIACYVKQNASKFPPDQLREYVLSQNSSFMENINRKLKEVFKQFTQEQFQQNVEKYYKNDLEVQYHLKRYKEEFDKAVLGVTPEFKEQVVTFLSPQKLLKITRQILEAKMQRIVDKINQKMTNQQMVIILKAQKQQQKTFRAQKLRNLGLIGKDEELTSIYEFSVAKYIKVDKDFQQKYRELLQQYKMKYQQHVDTYCNFPRSESKNNLTLK